MKSLFEAEKYTNRVRTFIDIEDLKRYLKDNPEVSNTTLIQELDDSVLIKRPRNRNGRGYAR